MLKNSTVIKSLFNFSFVYRKGIHLHQDDYDCIEYYDRSNLTNLTSTLQSRTEMSTYDWRLAKFIKYFKKDILDYIYERGLHQNSKKKNRNLSPPGFEFIAVLNNGHYRFDYTETMYKLENVFHGGKNITLLNEYRDLILNVTYNSSIETYNDESIIVPEIENWEFREVSQWYFDLEINFTLPLNVSQEIKKDQMMVEIYHNFIFKSLRTGKHIPLNTTCEPFDVPAQPKVKERNLIYFLTIGTATSVIISIVIPLTFMLCLKFSMDKAWHFYLMLQVVSNIKSFNILITPASAYPTILVIH